MTSSGESSLARSALRRFVLLSLGSTLLLAAVAWVVSARIAEDQVLIHSRHETRRMAESLAAPLITPALRAGDRAALRDFDTAMRRRMADGSVRHVRLFDETGRVLWADDPDLVGRQVDLDPGAARLFGTERAHGAVSPLSDIDASTSVDTSGHGDFIEVYVGAHSVDGEPFVFEAYLPTDDLTAAAATVRRPLLLLSLTLLLLLQLSALPLGVRLARRVSEAERERAALLRRSLDQWHVDRQRLALDLHDGVVQDLASASLAVRLISETLPEGSDAVRARQLADQTQALLDDDLRQLRSLARELAPGVLRVDDLPDAVQRLLDASPLRERGWEVEVSIAPQAAGDAVARGLAYRVLREGVRNAVQHSQATRIRLNVERRRDDVCVRVCDEVDRTSPGPVPSERRVPGGDGLRLLSDVVADLGGELSLVQMAGGSCLEARFPRDLEAALSAALQ